MIFEYRVFKYRVSEYRVLRRISGRKTEEVTGGGGGENSSVIIFVTYILHQKFLGKKVKDAGMGGTK
jgi:hypothetical protein